MAIEIVDFPINIMVIFHSYVKLPEGIMWFIPPIHGDLGDGLLLTPFVRTARDEFGWRCAMKRGQLSPAGSAPTFIWHSK